jgi:hypothetical protein
MSGTRQTYRSRVLRVVNAETEWLQARQIAQRTSLTYHQTIFALNALYNTGAIARSGRKSTARWGSVLLIENNPTAEALATLEQIFHGFRPTLDP